MSWRIQRRLLPAALGVALSAAAPAHGEPLRLRFPGGRELLDRRNEPLEDLLRLALQAAGRAVQIERVPGLTQPRRLLELVRGGLDVGFIASSHPELGRLPVLRQPLRRGLLGLRLILTRRELLPSFARMQRPEQLNRWRLGYGADWADIEQMRALGLTVVPADSYTSLFRMLAQGRSDWLHRGASEVWAEIDEPDLLPPGLALVPGLALFYPLDDYFCMSPQRAPELLPPLQRGLAQLQRDGGYLRWFRHWHGDGLARLQLAQRRVIHLAGYGVPPGTPLAQFDIVRLGDAQGELALP